LDSQDLKERELTGLKLGFRREKPGEVLWFNSGEFSVVQGIEEVVDGVRRRTANSERASKCSIVSGAGGERRLETLRASASLQTSLCMPLLRHLDKGRAPA
jgi:hypothetical protein